MLPQDVERYVLVASDASNLQHQQQANSLLHQWVSTTGDQILADTMVQVVRLTRQEVVLFYTLTIFLRLDDATPHQRRVFRQDVLAQLLLVNGVQSSWSPTYLRTKVGVLLARFIQLDFPHAWPDAFDDLQEPTIVQTAPDILLRTLVALMDDFGKDETERNSRIKNHVRGYTDSQNPTQFTVPSPAQSISGQLLRTVTTLLQTSLEGTPNGSSNSNGLGGSQHQQIDVLCLTVLKGFMSWADLMLLLTDNKVLPLIFAALAVGSRPDSTTGVDAGVMAVECMEELIARGMEDDKKVSMLRHTKVLEEIHAHVDLVTVDASPIDVVLEVAKFINRTGLEILPLLAKQSSGDPENVTLEAQLMDLSFRCFAYDDIDVSGAVIPLAGSLVLMEEQQQQQRPPQSTSQKESVVPRLLAITYAQMKYPPDFQYDYEDDDDAEEEMYRTELRKLNQKLVRVNPELCLQFLCQALSQLPLPLSSSPTHDIVAALSLVYNYCEGIRPAPGMKVVMRNETFCNLLIGLHSSDICQHPHREVLTLYYETSVRYYPLLTDRPDLLQKVLEAMSGVRGLQHDNPRVRSRCCYLLLRLVKSVGSSSNNNSNNNGGGSSNVLRPYVETAVSGIQGLLTNGSSLLRPDDILNLFETIGLLLGRTGLAPSEQQKYLTLVMTPHVRSIEATLRDNKDGAVQDPDMYGETLAGSIAAIAFLSKGFKSPPAEVQMVLLETLQICLTVLQELPGNEEVRSKTFIFVQRMILCLEDRVLPTIPRLLYLLIIHCSAQDILDVAQLFNQLCLKFKAGAVDALDSNLLPFLHKCQTLSNAIAMSNDLHIKHHHQQGHQPRLDGHLDAPHTRIEQLSIQKLLYTVLQHLVSQGATAVLLSPTNASTLQAILQSMSEGAIHVTDPVVKKSCLIFFRDLLDQWVPVPASVPQGNGDSGKVNGTSSSGSTAPDYVVHGYIRFVCSVLIPGMMQYGLGRDSNFNVNDANQYRCMAEVAIILERLQNRVPDIFRNEVLTAPQFTDQLGMSHSLLDGFRCATNRNDFEACLKAYVMEQKTQVT